MKKVISNFTYQAIFQIVKMLTPLITIPIVSHALGPKNIGLYNFTQSITQYFVLFAGLGMTLYGQRTIAQVREDKLELSKKFWELEAFAVMCASLMVILFFGSIKNSEYLNLYLFQSLTIISVMFDISWFFMEIEDFKMTSIRSLLITVITFFLIVLFVHNKTDTLVYIAIQSGGILCSQLIMWPFLFKKINFVKPVFKNVIAHFKDVTQYFVPQVAIMLYTNMNKTLLGVMDTPASVGYFSNAMIGVTVGAMLINTVDTVLLPKISNLHVKNDRVGIFKVLDVSLNLQLFFTIPASLGVMLISPKLVPWFFGDEFAAVKIIMPILAVLIVINPMGSSLSRQWLIPIGNLKDYNISVFVGAIVGLIINLSLIPIIGVYGAVMATVVSEFFVTFSRVREFVRSTGFNYKVKEFLKYGASGLLMYIITFYVTKDLNASIFTTIIQIVMAASLYLLITTMMRANPLLKIVKNRKI